LGDLRVVLSTCVGPWAEHKMLWCGIEYAGFVAGSGM
jgi:hypothetical protein